MTLGKTRDTWKDKWRFGKTKITNLNNIKQDGAVEARWAHNPKVDRSKLFPAIMPPWPNG